ncbi:MAG: radical SAM protein [Chloroflexi bacterium]|nr:radical SAM protein [Chloroflexota bacterium]MBM3173695.1 radical SAM protein [Chloroflexota bacterium]MBM3176053.1 radical SAM protein [Chloroflexota bacterium]MBM4450595.1 radical SAM protein [Chloroflexota bacterium]
MKAAYLKLHQNGKLAERIKAAKSLLRNCRICPRQCNIDRLSGERGKCRTNHRAVVSSYGPHFGEESPLVGKHGSGTIFFTNCNLACIFCQNYTISQLGEGITVTSEELANMMLSLQSRGCHNINLVSPTHVVPQILDGLQLAAVHGLNVPLVYNSGGYDSITTLKLLDGIVDIYMPDMKYADEATAMKLSDAEEYPSVNRAAVKEMHRQVGDLQINSDGVATRGLLIRHLVLTYGLAGTENTMNFIAREVSQNSYVNIMAQYRPCYKAYEVPELARPVSLREFREAVGIARGAGLNRLDHATQLVAETA